MIDKGRALQAIVSTLEHNLCVLAEDYRFLTYAPYNKNSRTFMEALVKWILAPYGATGILENHDWLEMVPGLERCGIRMLLNETQALEKGSDAIWLLGLDDVHYYEQVTWRKPCASRRPTRYGFSWCIPRRLFRRRRRPE